ncbi:MAG: hypothetical protein H6740_25415 [Alphaproteobacteria bacterium]|nr:hypothetical protein [Alphaproteobacteria bacterium]
MRLVLGLLLLACWWRRGPDPVESVEITEDEAEAAPAPAGQLLEGRYVDARLGFSAPLLEGWSARVGDDPFPLRVVLTDSATGASLEVWSYAEDEIHPRPRAGCSWVFEDSGPYEALRVREPLTVATCQPEDPRDPKVLGVYVLRSGQAWHLEAVYPEGSLAKGMERVEAVMWGMRFE